jgi:hypothetical protein
MNHVKSTVNAVNGAIIGSCVVRGMESVVLDRYHIDCSEMVIHAGD